MANDNLGYSGTQSPGYGAEGWGAVEYIARSILNRICTTTLVRVVAVNNDGALAAAGLIDVQPLVNQVNPATGSPEPHGVIHNIPYLRMQGGTNAVIMDPQVDDIGYVGFGSHDLSAVIATKDQANPASFRRFDIADAVYIGGVLNGVPEQYIRFSSTGIEMVSPTKIRGVAPIIEWVASDKITSTATNLITETAPQITNTASTGITLSTATYSLTATSTAGFTSPNSTFTGNLSVVSGNVTFSGTLAVSGGTTLAGVTAGGKDIGGTHKHSGVTTGAGVSGGPI